MANNLAEARAELNSLAAQSQARNSSSQRQSKLAEKSTK